MNNLTQPDAVFRSVTIDGKLRARFVQAIMDAWDKRRPTQTSSMSIEAANACINVLRGD